MTSTSTWTVLHFLHHPRRPGQRYLQCNRLNCWVGFNMTSLVDQYEKVEMRSFRYASYCQYEAYLKLLISTFCKELIRQAISLLPFALTALLPIWGISKSSHFAFLNLTSKSRNRKHRMHNIISIEACIINAACIIEGLGSADTGVSLVRLG